MADFVQVSKNHMWPNIPPPPTYKDYTLTGQTSPDFFQEVIGSAPPRDRSLAKDRYIAYPSNAPSLAAESFLWPVHAIQDQNPMPYAAATAGAFLLAPMLVVETTIGSAIFAGYLVGATTFFAQNSLRQYSK